MYAIDWICVPGIILRGFKSGERAGQPMSPRYGLWDQISRMRSNNFCVSHHSMRSNEHLPQIPIEHQEIWAVVPSCWNQTLSMSWSIFNFGLRKVFGISQYQPKFSHCNVGFLEEVETQHTEFCYSIQRTIQRASMQLTRVVFGPVSKVLLIR